MKFLSSFSLLLLLLLLFYFLFFFTLHYVFIVITAIVIVVNLVSHELVILMGKNGYVRIIFEIKTLNSNSPALRGRLVCVYPHF